MSYRAPSPPPEWFRPLIDSHLLWLQHRKGRSPSTVATYRCMLNAFGVWIDKAGIGRLVDLKSPDLRAWQDGKWECSAVSSQRVAASAVKGLLKWCEKVEIELSAPKLYAVIETPSPPPLNPKPISRVDLDVLKKALEAPASSDIIRLRTRALFWALFSSGSRIRALLSLDRDSINDGTAVVTQKGGRKHILVFSDLAVDAIREYVRARNDGELPMFTTHRTRHVRLGGRGAQRGWNQLCRELGIPRFTNHSLRHTCATAMLRARVDVLVIARHIGHRNLQTIAGYAEVGLDVRREAVAALS